MRFRPSTSSSAMEDDNNSHSDSSSTSSLEEFSPLVTHDLLPKLQTLQLFPLVVPQEVMLEGIFSMHLDTEFRIKSFQFEVKKVIKQAYYRN